MNKVRFALVGCGTIAKKHVQVIQNYLDGAEIVGFCDKVYDRANAYGVKLGVPAFSSVKDMGNMFSIGIKVTAQTPQYEQLYNYQQNWLKL